MSPTALKSITVAALLVATVALAVAGYAFYRGGQPPSLAVLEATIKNYLLANPELLLEVGEALEKQQKTKAQAESKDRIAEEKAALYQSPHDFVLNPEGRLTLVEFFDYNCGYCKRMFPALVEAMAKEKDVRFVFKELPILGEDSVLAARAAFAAKQQGKYMELHTALMQLRGPPKREAVMALAQQVGLDSARLERDMQSAQVTDQINANRQLAQNLNIRGTPTLIVGDTLVPGAIDLSTLRKLVAEARSNCTTC